MGSHVLFSTVAALTAGSIDHQLRRHGAVAYVAALDHEGGPGFPIATDVHSREDAPTLSCAVTRLATERYGELMALKPMSERMRRMPEFSSTLAGKASCKKYRVVIEPTVVNDLEHLCFKLTEKSNGDVNRFVVLYFHGGGCTLDSSLSMIGTYSLLRAVIGQKLRVSSSSFSDVKDIQLNFFIANYRKTPMHKFSVPQEDVLLAYEHLVKHHKMLLSNIIVAGDSAGARLVMSTLLAAYGSTASNVVVNTCGTPLWMSTSQLSSTPSALTFATRSSEFL